MSGLQDAGGVAPGQGPELDTAALDRLMPLHVWVGPTGHVLHAGPTLAKLRPGADPVGQRLLELFEVRRPRSVRQLADLLRLDGAKVQLAFREAPHDMLKGVLVRLAAGQGVLLNLSLGIGVVDAAARFSLTRNDFPATDPTVEMLYLIEAQSAIWGESRKLTRRLEGAKIAAEEQAYTDTLTGLKNRRAMDHILGRMTDPAADEDFGLMHVDLDFFKEVNDTHGHAAGDHVLQQAARILVEETRAQDVVVRAGGDEFVLICRDCDDLELLNRVAQRIIDRLEEPILFDGQSCRVSASIGTTLSSGYARLDAAEMLGDADKALYASKEAGRARHTVHAHPPGPGRA